jgi:hypothetical protein
MHVTAKLTNFSGLSLQMDYLSFFFLTEFCVTFHLGKLPIQWVPEALSLGLKRPGREADHSPPRGVEAQNGGAIPPLSHTPSWHSA